MNYLHRKDGMDLFRAYIERRTADKEFNQERKQQLLEQLPTQDKGVPHEVCMEITNETLRLRILEELDPIIQDLLKICKSQQESPVQANQLLVELRSALRIGKGHSPYDTAINEKRLSIERQWVQAYLLMQDNRIYLSQSKIAKNIAETEGASERTVISYWENLKQCDPADLNRWANHIIWQAKRPTTRAKREKLANRKPKAKEKRRITFGRNRVNQ